jgi:hypothetical protein
MANNLVSLHYLRVIIQHLINGLSHLKNCAGVINLPQYNQ